MILWVNFDGFMHSLDFNQDSTILDLKNQLEQKLGVPVGQQHLAFEGHSLPNESKVLACQITHGSQLTLVPLQLPVNEVSIYYRGGRTTPITIRDNTTIDDLKKTAEMLLHIRKEYIDLMCGGSSLEDHRLVRSYEQIRDRDDLRLIKKYRIKVMGRDRSYSLLVHGEKSVEEVKQMLRQTYGVPAATMRLKLPGSRNDLEDGFTLEYYGITEETILLSLM